MADIFQLHGRDGQAVLQQWHGQAIEIAQIRIARRRFAALEHERIADDYAHARGAAIPFHGRLLHVIERVENDLQFRRIFRRDGLSDLPAGPSVDSGRPLKIRSGQGATSYCRNLGLKERRGERGLPIAAVVASNRDWGCLQSDRSNTKRSGRWRAQDFAWPHIPEMPFQRCAT
jgi:hypothetical protein